MLKQVLTIIAALLLLTPLQASAEEFIAKAVATRGDSFASSTLSKKSLKRGAKIYKDDTITTKKESSVKLRFVDGTLLSIEPNSELKLAEYKFNKDATNNKMHMNLVKGGFKTVTGLINKKNKDALSIDTPVAVLAIRGSVLTTAYRKKLLSGHLPIGLLLITNKETKESVTVSGNESNNAFTITRYEIKTMPYKAMKKIVDPCN